MIQKRDEKGHIWSKSAASTNALLRTKCTGVHTGKQVLLPLLFEGSFLLVPEEWPEAFVSPVFA